ncbi:acyl-CoA dehydrogenase family protein [Streptomonospora arabica]|uniref:Acyl-CoA dehydrogenase family protein n=1 Tax=Streptomonospora arabica TaxID=412417 RepID=A0ABV9SQG9_9ACTN
MTDTGATPAGCRSLDEAVRIADEALFPAAPEVDGADRVPGSHFDLLAEKGFYGFAAPGDLTALDFPSYAAACRAVESLAGGCLATTLVWMQHHGAVSALAKTGNDELRETRLKPLAEGRLRSGVAVTAAVRPGTPMLRAEPVDGGWVFDGSAPWVSGWGMVDTLYTAARDADDLLVMALLDAEEGESVSAGPPARLVAAQASRTVTVRFSRHFVPRERVAQTVPLEAYRKNDPESVRFNGNLALGVAGRAIALMGDDGGALSARLGAARRTLLHAAPEDVPAARAAVSQFAVSAAAALAVHVGGRSLLADAHAQRLTREATFLLAFGSRPAVRAALLRGLGAQERSAGGAETA